MESISYIVLTMGITMLIANCVNLISLGLAYSLDQYHEAYTDAESFSELHSRAIFVLTVSGIIGSACLIAAWKTRIHWLIYPYAFYHAWVFLHAFIYLFMYYIQAHDRDLVADTTQIILKPAGQIFAYNIKLNHGSYILFSLMIMMCFTAATFIPLFYFIKDCYEHPPARQNRVQSNPSIHVDTGSVSMVPLTGSELLNPKKKSIGKKERSSMDELADFKVPNPRASRKSLYFNK